MIFNVNTYNLKSMKDKLPSDKELAKNKFKLNDLLKIGYKIIDQKSHILENNEINYTEDIKPIKLKKTYVQTIYNLQKSNDLIICKDDDYDGTFFFRL